MGAYIGGEKIISNTAAYKIFKKASSYIQTTVSDTSGTASTKEISFSTWAPTSTTVRVALTYGTLYLCDDIYGANYVETSYSDVNFDNVTLENQYIIYTNSSNQGYCVSKTDYPYFRVGNSGASWCSSSYITLYVTLDNVSSMPGCSDGKIKVCGIGGFLKYGDKYLGFGSIPSVYSNNYGTSATVSTSCNISTYSIDVITKENDQDEYSVLDNINQYTNINLYLKAPTETKTTISENSRPVYMFEKCIISYISTGTSINPYSSTYLYSATLAYMSCVHYTNKSENVSKESNLIQGG